MGDTPFERPSLGRWILWLLALLISLSAVLLGLLSQMPPKIRQGFLDYWVQSLQTPEKILGILFGSLALLAFVGLWYGLRYSMARDDLEDDPRVREPFKERFVRGELQSDDKVVCDGCGKVYDAIDIDCPECGTTEVEEFL